jgi:hypothetical protein
MDRALSLRATPVARLEIGPGTGQATIPLARRRYRVVAVEVGAGRSPTHVAAAGLIEGRHGSRIAKRYLSELPVAYRAA